MINDPLSLFVWMPLQNMAIAESHYGKELGLRSHHSKWGVGQLLYLNLDVRELPKFIDLDRMNWDSIYGMDFATMTSILNTNKVACRTWQEVSRIFEIYRRNWKSRLLVSLFCAGLSKVGYLGFPLYYSELIGYPIRLLHKEGFLEILEKAPDSAFDWMVLRVLEKMSDAETRQTLLESLSNKLRVLSYPFLLFGSNAIASYRKLEKMGGKEKIIGDAIPKDVVDELYIMTICATSNLFYHGPNPKIFKYDDIFRKIHIVELTYFGADTSIRTSPLLESFQAELGHLTMPTLGEFGDALTRFMPQPGLSDPELSFDRILATSPVEMEPSVSLHRQQKFKQEEKWNVNPNWLIRLRTEDL